MAAPRTSLGKISGTSVQKTGPTQDEKNARYSQDEKQNQYAVKVPGQHCRQQSGKRERHAQRTGDIQRLAPVAIDHPESDHGRQHRDHADEER